METDIRESHCCYISILAAEESLIFWPEIKKTVMKENRKYIKPLWK